MVFDPLHKSFLEQAMLDYGRKEMCKVSLLNQGLDGFVNVFPIWFRIDLLCKLCAIGDWQTLAMEVISMKPSLCEAHYEVEPRIHSPVAKN